MSFVLDGPQSRSFEEAVDELARLDFLALQGPSSVTRLLWILALTELTDRTPETLYALTASAADPRHDLALSEHTRRWSDVVTVEERRARGGTLLTTARFASVAPTIGSYAHSERLETIWQERSRARPVLLRALDSAAWAPDREIGEVSASLLLCAGGRLDRVRLLPFVTGDERARDAAIDAWRSGESEPWLRLALEAVTRRTRRLREGFTPLLTSDPREEEAIARLGRAAITARRAAAELRDRFALTMPTLAERLALSRPAAADALDRLVSVGAAREVTGRARDRVYAYDAALRAAESALAASAAA